MPGSPRAESGDFRRPPCSGVGRALRVDKRYQGGKALDRGRWLFKVVGVAGMSARWVIPIAIDAFCASPTPSRIHRTNKIS